MASTIITQPYSTPPGEEVTSIDQCISIEPETKMFIVYKIGQSNENLSKTFVIRNLTTNVDFLMGLHLPPFLKSDIQTPITILRKSFITVTVSLIEPKMKDMVLISKNIDSKIVWRFEPQNISGPIYI